MRNKSIFTTVGAFVFAFVIIVGVYFVNRATFNNKYAWINLSKVYNDFGLKKDLEQEFSKIENARKKIIDSLEVDLKFMVRRIEASPAKNPDGMNEFQAKKENFLLRKQQFDEDNDRLRTDYNNQVLNQLNQYVKEYAKENNIPIVFGADGTGSVMYADEPSEITNDVLVYINNKYKAEN